MKRVSFFLYGLVCYAIFFGTFLYAIGFVGGIVVPKSIDSAPSSSLGRALLIDAALLTVFALQHSVMARQGFKRLWTKIVPQPIERSTYVLAASAALLLLFWKWEPIGGVVWQVASPRARLLLNGASFAGWMLVLISTFLVDHFDLFGLRQVWLQLRNKSYEAVPFTASGLYRYVRHPIYLGFIVAFWAAPAMTVAHLVFAVATTLYILVAIQFEERDMVRAHGARYEAYRAQVSMLVPRPPKKAGGALLGLLLLAPLGATAASGKCMSDAKEISGIGLKFCSSPESCKRFCTCACTFDPHKWGTVKNDGSTVCRAAPASGPGMLAPGAAQLKPLPKLKNVTARAGLRATKEVIDGLTRLDAFVASAPWRTKYKVKVLSCYRPHLEDTEPECGFVLKAQYLFNKYKSTPPKNAEERDSLAWAKKAQDPMKLGLSYPGATPHSTGGACDVILVDAKNGREAFGCAAGNDAKTRAASRSLDEALTKASARRLSYEAWHYEWGTNRGCKYPDCDKYWPPKCHP